MDNYNSDKFALGTLNLFIFALFMFLILSMFVLGAPPAIDKIITFTGGRNNQFCGVSEDKDIRCDKQSGDPNNDFKIEDQADGTYALKSVATGQYCHDQGSRVACHSDQVGPHEKFHWIDQGGDKFSLSGPKSGKKRLFCADDQQGISCSRPKSGAWENFTLKTSRDVPAQSSWSSSGDDDGYGGGGASGSTANRPSFWSWLLSFFS